MNGKIRLLHYILDTISIWSIRFGWDNMKIEWIHIAFAEPFSKIIIVLYGLSSIIHFCLRCRKFMADKVCPYIPKFPASAFESRRVWHFFNKCAIPALTHQKYICKITATAKKYRGTDEYRVSSKTMAPCLLDTQTCFRLTSVSKVVLENRPVVVIIDVSCQGTCRWIYLARRVVYTLASYYLKF